MSPLVASSGSGVLDFPILTVLVVIPAVGALLVGLLSRRRPELVKATAVLVSLTAAALGGWMLVEFQTGEPGFQFVSRQSWIADLGISWHLGVDGISLFLVVLTLFVFPIALLATDPGHDEKPYYAWLLVLEAGCLGTFLALDLFLFFVMFEIVLVPMYFLIGGWGHGRRVYAAVKFFLYTMLGSAMMLVGILTLVFLTSSATGNPVTFDLVELANTQALAVNTARWVFLAFALAFSVKVPLFPLHTWLPDAHTEAPTAGSVILAGVMLKLGTYGFLRFGLFLFPEAAVWFAPAMVTLGVIGILYAAVVATVQKDLKRLVAYSSVAHLGFIVLGTFAFTTQGLTGSVLQMVNHGLSTGALFLLVGMIYERRHTRQIAELGGLQKPAPIMAVRLHRGHALLDRPARSQRIRRRVPDPRRVLPDPRVVGRGRRPRGHRRRPLPALGLPAGLPRPGRGRERRDGRHEQVGADLHGPAPGRDRVPRDLSQAGAGAHRARGERADRPPRGVQRLPPARHRGPGSPGARTRRAR